MNRADRRVVELARVLADVRSALGLPPDGRACVMQAFAVDDAELRRLHEALGHVIEVAAEKQRARRTRRRAGSLARGTGH